MISFLPLITPHDPAGRSLEETEPDSTGATQGVEAAGVWALSPQAEWVRWEDGARCSMGWAVSGPEPRSAEGLGVRGERQQLQLTCPRMGSPMEPTSWEHLSPRQATQKVAHSGWELTVIPYGVREASSSVGLTLSHTE